MDFVNPANPKNYYIKKSDPGVEIWMIDRMIKEENFRSDVLTSQRVLNVWDPVDKDSYLVIFNTSKKPQTVELYMLSQKSDDEEIAEIQAELRAEKMKKQGAMLGYGLIFSLSLLISYFI